MENKRGGTAGQRARPCMECFPCMTEYQAFLRECLFVL